MRRYNKAEQIRASEFIVSKYRTTKILALQVSNHDSYWGGPKEAPSKMKRLIKIAILLPAFALFIMPSFKIGRAVFRTPTFVIPDSIKQGSVFTVPADDEVSSIQLEGKSVPELKPISKSKTKPTLYLVAASGVPQLDLVLNYKAADKHLSLKMLLPHFEHPSYDVFNKQIKIEPPEANDSTVATADGEPKARAAVIAPLASDLKAFDRTDGLIAASCWKEPSLDAQPVVVAKHGYKSPPRSATLSAAGNGEVVQILNPAPGEKALVVYHGGGLYSRYFGLKETKFRKGDRITAGQSIGSADAGTWKKPANAHWDLYLNQTELNRAGFLALSTQLCETK